MCVELVCVGSMGMGKVMGKFAEVTFNFVMCVKQIRKRKGRFGAVKVHLLRRCSNNLLLTLS